MLFNTLILTLLSTSVTARRDKSVLYSRTAIIILLSSAFIAYDNLFILFLAKGIGIFGGLFHTTAITNFFHVFIYAVTSAVLILTAFYPRKVWVKQYSSPTKLIFTKFTYFKSLVLNKMREQLRITEYSLIILFIVTGSVFLISTSDLVSIFLSIELQSYGLYLLSTIYRDSKPATSGGLMYFLLGGSSSCCMLLSISLIYAKFATTNLDSLYIITSISNASKDNLTGLLCGYHYLHISLLFMGVGFLFKVSAAPLHFWSPNVYDSISAIVTTFVTIITKISTFIFFLEFFYYTGRQPYLTNRTVLRSGFSGDKGKGKAIQELNPESPPNNYETDTDSEFEREMEKAKQESLTLSNKVGSSSKSDNTGFNYDEESLRQIFTLALLKKDAKSVGDKFNSNKIQLDNSNTPQETKDELLNTIKQEHYCIKQHINNLENKLHIKGIGWEKIIQDNYPSSSDYSSPSNYSSDEDERVVKRVKFSDENKKFFTLPVHLNFSYAFSPIFRFLFVVVSSFIFYLIDSGVLDNLFILFDINITMTEIIFFCICINLLTLLCRYYRTMVKLYNCYLDNDFFVIYVNIYFTIILLIFYLSPSLHTGVFYL